MSLWKLGPHTVLKEKMNNLLQNFSIADCVAIGDGKSNYEHWDCFNTLVNDGAIDSAFVTVVSSFLRQAAGNFFSGSDVTVQDKEALAKKMETSLVWLEEFIKRNFDHFPHTDEMLQPLYWEHMEISHSPGMSVIPILAAYTIVCIDRMVTELKASKEETAIKYSMFAAGGISALQRSCATIPRGPSFNTIMSAIGKNAASAAHKETRQLKEEVRKYWLEHIDKALSNDNAAGILMKQFPLTMRTLSSYVAKFKKTVSQ